MLPDFFFQKAKAEDVEGSIYGRVFGNEMLFMHSKTLKSPFKKMPASWLDLLIQLSKKQDYALTQSVQFMDVSMVVPTCAGLPIHLDVNGTGTVDLALNGKMDLRKFASSPRSMDIDGEIRPRYFFFSSRCQLINNFFLMHNLTTYM